MPAIHGTTQQQAQYMPVYAMISLLVKASSRLTRRPVCPLKVQHARVKAHYVYYCIVHVGMVDQSRIYSSIATTVGCYRERN